MYSYSHLSKHFTYDEMTDSATATRCCIANHPDAIAVDNLMRLCKEVLEPARAAVNVPCRVTSGYRCRELNRRIRGARNSAHIAGRAADVVFKGVECYEAALMIAEANVEFDKLILEFGRWIHIQTSRRSTTIPRQLVFTASHAGRMVRKPRVIYEPGLKNYW